MKKQNKNFLKRHLHKRVNDKIVLGVLFLVFGLYLYAFAADILLIITNQTATWRGSSNSQIITSSWFSTDTDNKKTLYYNQGDNSTAIGNYFQGYYHDTVLWFFILNWSPLTTNNVRIVWGTTGAECSGYAYKLWGYAYSNTVGFIDFDYDDSIYVYYCLNDSKLYGYAYNKYVGFQNFKGITFNLFPTVTTTADVTSSAVFVNDVTKINQATTYTWSNSNTSPWVVWWEQINLDDTEESTFYIIK